MSIIYVPKGKAREYSPLAANLFTGCTHGCKYCYVPNIRRMTYEQYTENAEPRRNILKELEKDCKKHYGSKQHVQLSFVGDPYDKADNYNKITREALKLFHKYKIPVSILTKGGTRALRDIDIFLKMENHIIVGASFTFEDEKDSLQWEPGAAIPHDRINMLKELKEAGIKTWASFEPVISPQQSLSLIRSTKDIVDYFKIGKLNNYKGIDKKIDWTSFTQKAISILGDRDYYIKKDLAEAVNIKIPVQKTNQDEMAVEPYPHTDDFAKGADG